MEVRCIALLVFMMLLPIYANAAKTLSKEDMQVISEDINTINQGLPRMIDKVTRWDSIVRAGSSVSYVFTLLNYTKETAPDDIGFRLYLQAQHGYCMVGGDISQLRDSGVDLSLYYRDVDGTVIATLMINNDDCHQEDAKIETTASEPELGDTIVVDPEWLSLSSRLFESDARILPSEANNVYERLYGKWQNVEAPVMYQFLSNGHAQQIEGDKLKLLKYSVPEINNEQRMILVEINENNSESYKIYIQFIPDINEARVAVVRDGNKTFEKWVLAGGPDMLAIANQYSRGKKPWISWHQVLESKEYKQLSPEKLVHIRAHWEELFDNNEKQ